MAFEAILAEAAQLPPGWLLIAKPWVILDDLKANAVGKSMLHLIWYILIGLIAGVMAKSVMHVHITIFWTIVLGIIGLIVGGSLPTCFRARQTNDIIPPASSFPYWARSWFSSFAIS